MNIWTCKRSCFSLVLVLMLPSCSGGGFALPSFDFGLGGGEFRRNVALVSAEMAEGQVKLVPPDGFCIDKRGLQQNFAVLARCDSLGGRGGAQDAMLGMITVAVTPEEGDVVLGEFIADIVPANAEQLSDIAGDEMALVQLRGDVPSGADSTHWRGVTRASGHLLSVAAYAPMDGEFAGEAARNSLQQMASRTRAASEQLVATRRATGESNAKQAGLTGALRGLFNRKSSTE